MRRINPIVLLVVLNVVLIVFRDVLLSDEASAALAESIESALRGIGVFGYVGVVLGYVLCAFFFVPLLIPLNILGGALYGAWAGTVVALAGITLGTIASTISVRHVFIGMQKSVEERPRISSLLAHADRHRNLVIVVMRFAVVIPYLVQNIALAATNISLTRLTLVTAASAIPGAAIYSFLGAGLVHAEQVDELVLYLALPIVVLLAVSGLMIWLRKRYEA